MVMPKHFVHVASSVDGSQQSVGITATGHVYTWGRSNEMGQLGRNTESRKDCKTPSQVKLDDVKAVRGFAGGMNESGHTAVLDSSGNLWVAGCDRWQQLGLGSAEGGASGYTWENGRIWRECFTRNDFLKALMKKRDGSIRDVALGGDHTIVLSSNKRDVYAFGKGGEGQLGLVGKHFVAASVRSTILSSSKEEIAAVCAIRNCSLTLDDTGKVLEKAGRCRMTEEMMNGLSACINRATRDGLLVRDSTSK
jgi:alpha-tubulin suppressor-like RCC1 family protein